MFHISFLGRIIKVEVDGIAEHALNEPTSPMKKWQEKVFISGFIFINLVNPIPWQNSAFLASGYITSGSSPISPPGSVLSERTTIYTPTRDEEDVFSLINYFAAENNVNINLALNLAEYESNFDPGAVNIYPNEYGTSTAGGVFMFIDKTWEDYCEGNKFNAYDNVSCAMKIIGEGGLSHWTADKNVREFLFEKGYLEKADI